MKNASGIAQLVLRLALGAGFILPVMDRLGMLGPHGSPGVSWGDWKHFIDYTNTLLPFAGRPIANILGLVATLSEAVFGICLVVGFKIKQIALGAAILTLCFGLCMAIFVGIGAPFNYPVFVFTGAGLVLSGIGSYRWSLDEYLVKK
ncbi:MAG: DoxX family protein [Bacteroidota bacterium]|nr:DoxX family protein [Bacteroidota bacterium]